MTNNPDSRDAEIAELKKKLQRGWLWKTIVRQKGALLQKDEALAKALEVFQDNEMHAEASAMNEAISAYPAEAAEPRERLAAATLGSTKSLGGEEI